MAACDIAFKLHKIYTIGAPDQAWLEVMANRFRPRIDKKAGLSRDPIVL